MLQNPLGLYFQRISEAWLVASVHLDAFIAEPQAYLIAVKWWILRKRVRAHGRFAPLLSRSPRAYSLWALRQDQKKRQQDVPDAGNAIVALVDVRFDTSGRALMATLESLLAEQLPVVLLGSTETPTLATAINQLDWDARPWLLPLVPGDRIGRGAVAAYRSAMNDPAVRLVYADDDLFSGRRRHNPHFKPGWNAELFRHYDYISGACILRADRSDLEAVVEATDWAELLTTRLVESGTPQHLPQVLHHRSRRAAPRLPAVPLDLKRDLPLVSIIVPTRNRVDLLRACLDGVSATDYPEIEVIVMDNDSDDPDTLAYLATLDPAQHRVMRHSGAFNYSAINNRAVGEARGRLLCLLNNDVEVTEPRWLATLVTQALRPEVGAVGARLLYPDGRIQHAGVVVGVGNAAGHAHRFLHPEAEGYFHRHNLPQFTTAVTAACLVVERDKFLAVGGLDESNFAVAFNDVDLCLRLNQRGWQSLYEPRATLIHHESVSRGFDLDRVGAARFAGELAALKKIWKTDEIVDPYHHPQLSRASEQFAVSI